jgi:hypothetical protein
MDIVLINVRSTPPRRNLVLTAFAFFPFEIHTQRATARKAAPMAMIDKNLFMMRCDKYLSQI